MSTKLIVVKSTREGIYKEVFLEHEGQRVELPECLQVVSISSEVIGGRGGKEKLGMCVLVDEYEIRKEEDDPVFYTTDDKSLRARLGR